LIKGGGIYINGQRVADEKARVSPGDAMHARYFVVRKGKKDNFLVRVDKDVSSS
jgi:tyrosyl-tRNA synthetase